jgi:hypothetical protein
MYKLNKIGTSLNKIKVKNDESLNEIGRPNDKAIE